MKWIQDNIITLILAVTTFIQAISAWIKNIQDAKNTETAEKNRHEESSLEYHLKEKQLDIQSKNSEKSLKNQLDKLKIQNSQKNYESFLFKSEQGIFEHYVTETRNAITKEDFPFVFPPDYTKLQSLVLLYCPSISEDIRYLDLLNQPFEGSGSNLSKEDFIKNQKEEISTQFDSIVKKLSHELMHK